MFRCLEERGDPLFSPSAFWRDLCDKHVALIKQHGFDRFKHTINFQYGQWPVCSFRNQQIRHLLKQLIMSGQIPYISLMSRLQDVPSIECFGWSPSCAKAYKFYVGLLWQLAVARDHLGCLDTCYESSIGGPIKVTYRGRLITQDLAQSSFELNSIADHSRGHKFKRIAEVGGGGGRFAFVFMHMFPDALYSIFDIPPALAISQNFLSQALGKGSVTPFDATANAATLSRLPSTGHVAAFLPYSLHDFPDRYFDLFVNVSSFDEMLPEQVDRYFDLIDKKCSGWLYLKGYASRSGSDRTRPWGLRQFPYRDRWRLIYEGVDALQSAFVERVYDLRTG